MSTPFAAALIVPVGQFIGAYYAPAPSTEHYFQVRVGPDIVRLGDDQFAVWGLAHGAPDRPADEPWTARSVVAAARAQGIGTAEEVLVGLLADYLLFEVTLGQRAAVEFAARHRLVPLMLGLGNSAEDPRVYSVGLPGQPLVTMSSLAYDLYQWAHLDNDLWSACEGAAATAVRIGIEDPVATDPARLLDAFLGSVHVFLGPNSVYFDTRLDRGTAPAAEVAT